MTTEAQATAGLALVLSFALLCVHQVRAASILLAVQCAATAVCAVVTHQPVMAVPPLLFAAGVWLVPGQSAPRAMPLGGAKLGIGAAAALAILCQSQGGLALPLAVILLAVLFAATRKHPLMHVMALIAIQNGIVLAAGLQTHHGVMPGAILAVACCLLPLPLAAALHLPTLMQRRGEAAPWIDVTLSLAIFVATLLVPLDLTASVFAPLLGLDGVMRSWQRRNRTATAPADRCLALLRSVFCVLAVCPADPTLAWIGVLAAIMTSLLPALPRLWTSAVLAFLGAGIALFGLLTLGQFIPGYLAIFIGFVTVAAIVPDLAAVLAILLLRLTDQAPWPPAADALGIAVAIIALLASVAHLPGKSPRAAVPLLQQGQASIAAFSVCLGQADGRFAALVLLVLLILTRAAARLQHQPVAGLAIAGLGGVPPLGVFPGLVLVTLSAITHSAWLLVPLGVGTVAMLKASLPKGVPDYLPALSRKATLPSVGWLPFALALLTGYFAPDRLVRLWHLLTAGRG